MKLPAALFTPPNLLSCFRFFAAPMLLLLAWNGSPRLYILVLVLAFLSDALDGYVARRLQMESEFGVQLDTWADMIMYIIIPISAWQLWPDVMNENRLYVMAVIAGYTLPALLGLIKFHRLPTYHTWGIKIAAAAIGSMGTLMLAGGPAWPFRLAVGVGILASLEQMAITLVLSEHHPNVRTLWHVLRQNYSWFK